MPLRIPAASRLDAVGWPVLLLFVFALPLSIAVSQILLTALAAVWLAARAAGADRSPAPAFFTPLLAYAAWTLAVSVPFSLAPATSLIESREVLLFLVAPIVLFFARGERARTVVTVALAAGAVNAVAGIVQYGILQYDNLGQRPSGSMGHYMTYAGLLMLMLCAALSRLLFDARDRAGALVVLPALSVALVVTLTRSAWIGAAAAAGLLLVLRDRRLLALAPVAAVVFVAVAPAQVTDRLYSTFDLRNPTNRDRLAMLTAGAGMVGDHPLTGIGPVSSRRSTPTTAPRPRSTRRTPTCTTSRCRSRPSAGCPRWPCGSGSSRRRRAISSAGCGIPHPAPWPRARWRRWPPCSRPGCSSTTSATPSS